MAREIKLSENNSGQKSEVLFALFNLSVDWAKRGNRGETVNVFIVTEMVDDPKMVENAIAHTAKIFLNSVS